MNTNLRHGNDISSTTWYLEYGKHEVLEVAWLALLLDPGEDTARQLGEVVHGDLQRQVCGRSGQEGARHLLVERLEEGVHEDLEHLGDRWFR